MDSKTKSNLWKKSESLFANSAPVFLSLAAIAGAATLAMFEYFGLVTDSMNSWYKFGLGLGVTVICIAYLQIAKGHWLSAILLSSLFGLYIFGGSFSGRSAITAETEKHAQFKATQAAETNNLKSRINEAITLVIDHKTIKDNNDLFATANAVINSNQDAPPLTINERRGDAVALLSRMNIHITAHEYEMLLTALFTLCLFIGTGTLSRAANARKLSGNSQEGKETQGDQELARPEKKTSFTMEEAERAVNKKISKERPTKITNAFVHDAIRKEYKTTSSIGNDKAAALVKDKNKELAEAKKLKGDFSGFVARIIPGGKK